MYTDQLSCICTFTHFTNGVNEMRHINTYHNALSIECMRHGNKRDRDETKMKMVKKTKKKSV